MAKNPSFMWPKHDVRPETREEWRARVKGMSGPAHEAELGTLEESAEHWGDLGSDDVVDDRNIFQKLFNIPKAEPEMYGPPLPPNFVRSGKRHLTPEHKAAMLAGRLSKKGHTPMKKLSHKTAVKLAMARMHAKRHHHISASSKALLKKYGYKITTGAKKHDGRSTKKAIAARMAGLLRWRQAQGHKTHAKAGRKAHRGPGRPKGSKNRSPKQMAHAMKFASKLAAALGMKLVSR